MPSDRYIVTAPVPEGLNWWDVVDTEPEDSVVMEVAMFSANFPESEQNARDYCAALNAR